MIKKIIIKIGDNVELFNGTFGVVSDIDYGTYKIKISGEHKYPIWFHILNIHYLNGIDCENNYIALSL